MLVFIHDPTFSDSSLGFKFRKSAHDVVMRAKSYIEKRYSYTVDLDLTKFFDTLNLDILINVVRETIKDRILVKLIKRIE